MIIVRNTPNNLGVEILGDYNDFAGCYEALHKIVGEEHQYPSYGLSRLRILGICYDMRHALMGNREYEFVENGINPEILKARGFLAPDKNLYLKINIFWPELLFMQMALNDFVLLHAKRNSREYFDALLDTKNICDETIAQIRQLQAAVNKCIMGTLTEITYKRMLGYIISKQNSFSDYLTHYIDLLNIKFINMDKEKRLKNISIMAKRIAEQGKEYQKMNEEILSIAKENNCPIEGIRINIDYPEDYEW